MEQPTNPYGDPSPNPYETLLPPPSPKPQQRGVRWWLVLIVCVLAGVVALSFVGYAVYRGHLPGMVNTKRPILAQAVYQDFVTAGIGMSSPSFNTNSCDGCPSKPTATAAWIDTSSGYAMNVYTFQNNGQAQAVAALGASNDIEHELIGVCILYFWPTMTGAQLAPYIRVMAQVC